MVFSKCMPSSLSVTASHWFHGLGDDILVNGELPTIPATPLKDGDEVQMGTATLRWHITDLRSEEVTDPWISTAAANA